MAIFLFVAGYLASLTVKIARESETDDARPADVIVVMGAAEYRGKPSPVLRARLDHALGLYQRGLAPQIMTTGGAGGDPLFTEGDVGRSYLIDHGVPPEAIIVEPEGDTTAHSVNAASEIMKRMGLRSAIIVSDGYHIFRAKRMMKARGVQAVGSPWDLGQKNLAHRGWLYFRQAVGMALWRMGLSS